MKANELQIIYSTQLFHQQYSKTQYYKNFLRQEIMEQDYKILLKVVFGFCTVPFIYRLYHTELIVIIELIQTI